MPGGQDGPKGGGCWVSSAVDGARLLTALDAARGTPVVSARAYRQMVSVPPAPYEAGARGRQPGLGWDVVQAEGRGEYLYHKNGGIAGVATYFEHRPGGIDWVLFFNASAGDDKDETGGAREWRAGIIRAITGIERWPATDLFSRFH